MFRLKIQSYCRITLFDDVNYLDLFEELMISTINLCGLSIAIYKWLP